MHFEHLVHFELDQHTPKQLELTIVWLLYLFSLKVFYENCVRKSMVDYF